MVAESLWPQYLGQQPLGPELVALLNSRFVAVSMTTSRSSRCKAVRPSKLLNGSGAPVPSASEPSIVVCSPACIEHQVTGLWGTPVIRPPTHRMTGEERRRRTGRIYRMALFSLVPAAMEQANFLASTFTRSDSGCQPWPDCRQSATAIRTVHLATERAEVGYGICGDLATD